MNPADRFKIDNLHEILQEIEKTGRLESLHDLEDRIIRQIADLVDEGTEAAKAKLTTLERSLHQELQFVPRSGFLISALKNAIAGALSAAKLSLF
ncbi:MAG: hypothetical protein PHH60_02040 [Candidatus Margulisbacteria bacterium]|nr:hypothetical protein [Candidatus Margulisiibacteriota bacterium]